MLFALNELASVLGHNLRVTNIAIIISKHDIKGMIRNIKAGDAYQWISTSRGLVVEPQGVEQPLDLSIPKKKMMLAFYLAA